MNIFRNLLCLTALIILSWEGYKLFLHTPDKSAAIDISNEQQGISKAKDQPANILANGRNQDIDSLRRAFARLDSRMSSFENQLKQLANDNSLKSAQALSVSDGEQSESAINLNEDELVLQDQQEAIAAEQRIEQIETSFQGEAQDASWAQSTSDKIYQFLESEMLTGTSIIDLECRSTVCRIEVSHRSFDDQENFDLNFGVDMPHAFSKFTLSRTEHDDGTTSTVMYAFREEQS
jgi:hypothetical protein